MPKAIVQATIGDYGKWRAVYDRNERMRTASSVTSAAVYRGVDDPNTVIVYADVADLAKAREALTSPEMRSSMQESGVVGAPNIHFVQ